MIEFRYRAAKYRQKNRSFMVLKGLKERKKEVF